MTFIKINNTLYPASISGKMSDSEWGGRPTKTIRLTMPYSTAVELFVDDVQWSIVEEYEDENNQPVQNEYDNSDYCLAGDIIDHRNGILSVKMGRATAEEILSIITGGTI